MTTPSKPNGRTKNRTLNIFLFLTKIKLISPANANRKTTPPLPPEERHVKGSSTHITILTNLKTLFFRNLNLSSRFDNKP